MKKIALLLITVSLYITLPAQESIKHLIKSNQYAKNTINGSLLIYSATDNMYISDNINNNIKSTPPVQSFEAFQALCCLESGLITPEEIQLAWNDNSKRTNLLNDKSKKIKKSKWKKYLSQSQYGNMKFGKSEEKFWNNTLQISQKEQIDFFRKLYTNDLPFSNTHNNHIKKLLFLKDTVNYRLYGISGMHANNNNPEKIWLTGFMETPEDTFFYAFNFENTTNNDISQHHYISIAIEIFREYHLYPEALLIEEELSKPTLDEMIGQMIMVGFDGTELSDKSDVIKSLKKNKAGGIILYEKNISSINSIPKLKELIQKLKDASKLPLFVSIDQEGGKVNRLKPKYGFPQTVTAASLGKKQNLDTTFQYTDILASTLAELGINLNYGPVLDVNTNPKNPIIAKYERSFSANPDSVAIHAIEFIKAHHKYGILTVLKHFPGHGSSTGDSHKGMVDVTETWSPIELIPYKKLIDSGYCDGIMTAHLINKQLESKDIPATLSEKIMTGLLRNQLNFNSVIFSDDMQMRAISEHYGSKEAIKEAILSGVDVVMFSLNIKGTEDHQAEEVHSIIKQLVRNGEISEERIKESYKRIMKMKTKML